MTIALMVIPPYNDNSNHIIQQISAGQNVISNYKLPIPHKFAKFGFQESNVWGNKDLIINPNSTKFDVTNPITKNVAMIEKLSLHAQKMYLVYPDVKSINLLYVLFAKQVAQVFVIAGGIPIKESQLNHMFQNSDHELLKQQYEQIMGPAVKTYKDTELTKTPNGATLRQYQQQMMDFAIEKKRVGLFVDMGLGKTLATLATINKLVESNQLDQTKPILIVAPITVALDTWAREASKWGYDMDVKINIKLSPKKRKELFDTLVQPQKKVTLVTTNPEQLPQLNKYRKENGIGQMFSMIIVDELSMFKSATSKRFQTISEIGRDVEYFIGLTGTPSPNNMLDLWSQLITIDPYNAKIFGQNFFVYREHFFKPLQKSRDGKQVYKWGLKPGSQSEILQRMKRNVISMQSDGLIDLPDISYDNVYVKLPKKAKDIYDKLDKKLRPLLAQDNAKPINATIDGENVEMANSAVLRGKLLQITSGAVYTGNEDPEQVFQYSESGPYIELHDAKLQAVKDIVENATSPVLLFFRFQSELERLHERFDFEHLDPHRKDFSELISRWNKGEVPFLVAHPGSAGHGLNLQDGGHTIIWLSPIDSNEQYRQANKRLHRSGQKHPVAIIHIIVENSVDEEILASLDEKEAGQQQLMKSLDIAKRG